MLKEYLHVEAQVELLESRGMTCGAIAKQALMREGYYAVVNGYAKPFLNKQATREAGADRYLSDADFAHVYALFNFDRDLRMLTFRELTRIEGMLRALAAAAFLEAHEGPEDYLNEQSYSTPQHYLLGERLYEKNLRHTLTTLSRYVHEHENDERGRDDARLSHYRTHYEAVPLWVVFSDFSYGNLYHFLALMRKEEQHAVCARLAYVLSCNASDDTRTSNHDSSGEQREQLSRSALIRDVGLQVEVRNICAHGERLYNARMGNRGTMGYDNFVRMLARFLASEELTSFHAELSALLERYSGISTTLDRVLAGTRIKDAIGHGS